MSNKYKVSSVGKMPSDFISKNKNKCPQCQKNNKLLQKWAATHRSKWLIKVMTCALIAWTGFKRASDGAEETLWTEELTASEGTGGLQRRAAAKKYPHHGMEVQVRVHVKLYIRSKRSTGKKKRNADATNSSNGFAHVSSSAVIDTTHSFPTESPERITTITWHFNIYNYFLRIVMRSSTRNMKGLSLLFPVGKKHRLVLKVQYACTLGICDFWL